MNFLQKNYSHVPDIGYVPTLDGIRAIAVLLVLLTHANFQFGANGFFGVDIFFALSGFLITTLLIEEFRKYGKIHFGAFYIRRTFRLFPALYVLLFFILCYILIYPIDPVNQHSILTEIWSSALYVHNISWLWGWGGWGKEEYLLLHTWSLANEEQYYLIWPFVLFLIFYIKNNRFVLYLLATIISLVLFWRLTSGVNQVLSMLWADSIFIGSFFAFVRYNFFTLRFNQWVLFFLITAILYIGIFPVKWQIDLYVGRSIVGIITGVLIVGLLHLKEGFLVKLLSNSLIVFVGKISYSLYLWHIPVFRLFKTHTCLQPHISFVLKFFVTFLVASLSYYFLEKKLTKVGRVLSNNFILKKSHN